MSFGLEDRHLDKIKSVFVKHPDVEEVVIYGSRAIGRYRDGSDIDLTMKGSNISFDELLKIRWQLDDLLLPWNIDLSLYRQIDDHSVLDHINRVGKVFYRKED